MRVGLSTFKSVRFLSGTNFFFPLIVSVEEEKETEGADDTGMVDGVVSRCRCDCVRTKVLFTISSILVEFFLIFNVLNCFID